MSESPGTKTRPRAMKYGSENAICCVRSSLIVIVERIRSAVPSSRNGIRLSEIASMNFGLTPSFAATALPISTSKPSTSPLCGFLTPNGGTSNLTPIVISPFAWILPRVVSAANFSTEASVAAGVDSPPPAAESDAPSSSPHAPSATAPATSIAPSHNRICPSALVVDDLVDELACALRLRVREELRGRPLLHDQATVDEHQPVAHLTGKAHLVRDDQHRHAVASEVAHDVQHLPDHLRVQRRGRLVEQHQLRVHRECPRDRHPLLLTPRQVRRVGVPLLGDTHAREQLVRPGARRIPRDALHLHRGQDDVVQHRHVGEQM